MLAGAYFDKDHHYGEASNSWIVVNYDKKEYIDLGQIPMKELLLQPSNKKDLRSLITLLIRPLSLISFPREYKKSILDKENTRLQSKSGHLARLPPEVQNLIMKGLDYLDALSLSVSCKFFWYLGQEHLYNQLPNLFESWAGDRIGYLGENSIVCMSIEEEDEEFLEMLRSLPDHSGNADADTDDTEIEELFATLYKSLRLSFTGWRTPSEFAYGPLQSIHAHGVEPSQIYQEARLMLRSLTKGPEKNVGVATSNTPYSKLKRVFKQRRTIFRADVTEGKRRGQLIAYLNEIVLMVARAERDNCLVPLVREIQRWRLFKLCEIVTDNLMGTERNTEWVLRNLETTEYVRSFLIGAKRSYFEGPWCRGLWGFSQIFMTEWALWKVEDGDYYYESCGNSWVGHRVEITTLKHHMAEQGIHDDSDLSDLSIHSLRDSILVIVPETRALLLSENEKNGYYEVEYANMYYGEGFWSSEDEGPFEYDGFVWPSRHHPDLLYYMIHKHLNLDTG